MPKVKYVNIIGNYGANYIPTKIHYVEALIHNVTVFGDR